MAARRSLIASTPRMSSTWTERSISGRARWARSPTPVKVGVNTSWPRARSSGRIFFHAQPPVQAPCTTTNVDIACPPPCRSEAGHKRARMSTRWDRSDLAQRAVARGRDDDDLGRRRALPGEGEDVLAVGDDEQPAGPAPRSGDGEPALAQRGTLVGEHERIRECRLDFDPAERGERRRVDAAAPGRAQ